VATTRKKSGTKKDASGTTAKPAAKKTAAKAGEKAGGKAKAPKATKPAAKAAGTKASAAKAPAKARATRATPAKPRAPEAPASQRVALAVAEAALDKKAVNVEIIDVAGKVDYADYIVVMSGTSDRQVNALARGIAEDVETKTKNKCLGVEGLPGGAWVLMDFGDVVVHIFHQDVRGYYDLESLWIDAARVPVPAT
jgi:ribosome-associated protein